jgi:hypothetical protein
VRCKARPKLGLLLSRNRHITSRLVPNHAQVSPKETDPLDKGDTVKPLLCRA